MSFKFEGSISSGTMRPEDLIPKFIKVLKELNEEWYFSEDPDTKRAGEKVSEEIESMELDLKEGDFFDDVDAADEDLEWLFDTLNELAPEGYMFGAHEGDGADFGFWPTDNEDVDNEDVDDEDVDDEDVDDE